MTNLTSLIITFGGDIGQRLYLARKLAFVSISLLFFESVELEIPKQVIQITRNAMTPNDES